jgi:hypothetical protein
MIKLLNILLETTPGLNYHLKHKLPLSENIYRYSSNAFIQLFTEARSLHRNGFLELCEEDRILLEETNIGEYGEYNGIQVPLDLPMLQQEIACEKCEHHWEVTPEDTHPALCHNCGYDNEKGVYDMKALEDWKSLNEDIDVRNPKLPRPGEYGGNIKKNMTVTDKDNNQLRIIDITDNKIVLKPTSYSGQTIIFPDNYNQFARIFEFWDYFDLIKINEADYHGKDVELNKPKRGGSKKFVVYVKDPKTKKVKKVQFGDTTGLSVKIDDPKARRSFAARHKCATERNRLSPNYWGCNIGRYWKSLGGSKNFSGYW